MTTRTNRLHLAALLFLASQLPCVALAQPSAAANGSFDRYASSVEARLAEQHRSTSGFLADIDDSTRARLRHGEVLVQEVSGAPTNLPGAMLHHWRATAFVPRSTAAGFNHVVRDFSTYPQHFAPEVLHATVLSQQPDHVQVSVRVRQKHVITVVTDATYDITYHHLDTAHGYSISHSLNINEVSNAGSPQEKTLTLKNGYGFLWRLNTYWSYEERDGGLYMEVESISLSRSIPSGLGWAIRPFVESVPRESLEFTMRSITQAMQSQ